MFQRNPIFSGGTEARCGSGCAAKGTVCRDGSDAPAPPSCSLCHKYPSAEYAAEKEANATADFGGFSSLSTKKPPFGGFLAEEEGLPLHFVPLLCCAKPRFASNPLGGSHPFLTKKTAIRRFFGGGGGIRTPGTLASTTVFETATFNHSATPPHWIEKGSAM